MILLIKIEPFHPILRELIEVYYTGNADSFHPILPEGYVYYDVLENALKAHFDGNLPADPLVEIVSSAKDAGQDTIVRKALYGRVDPISYLCFLGKQDVSLKLIDNGV